MPSGRADAEPVRRPRCGYPRAMTDQFKKGDKVTWQSHGSTAEGTVQKKITSDTEAAGRTVRASQDEPQYLVRSDKSGNDAVHKPEALTKKSGS
ncbi:hypothetical protein GCM10009645_45770 [Mycolicibacterium poriferae]|uniref:Hypervirulence associated protein TUDOR domain-containing protein n=2 Tax=Mycobacteriaceae TaxID=1762 RepID=A0A6N4VAS4_9MYCO|nr:hypothetical protein MPOR_22560 [Mycolicibacterium poriferae]